MKDKELKALLESAARELSSYIEAHNERLRQAIKPFSVGEPDYADAETCYLLQKAAAEILNDE